MWIGLIKYPLQVAYSNPQIKKILMFYIISLLKFRSLFKLV